MEFPFPNYEHPPIHEVSIGLDFAKLDRLLIPHVGLFWTQIRSEFPKVLHASPYIGREFTVDASTGLPMPRIWFVDPTDSRLLQLQSNRFNFNWRRGEGGEYPHFPKISEEFFRHYATFEKFAADQDIGLVAPSQFDLSYVNIFTPNTDGEVAKHFASLFKDFNWQSSGTRFLSAPAVLTWSATFALPDDMGTLVARVENAKRATDQAPVHQLELNARYVLQNDREVKLKDWIALAHEWIVKGFADLTCEKIQNEQWGRKK